MLTKSATFHTITRSILASLAGQMLLITPAPRLAAQEPCDCSCDVYMRMMELTAEAASAAQNGNFQPPSAELQQMSMCAGQCVRSWSQCADPDAADVFDRAESVTERARASQAEPEDPGLPKERLTPSYLEGTWCSVYGGQEVTQWRFQADGSYQVGMPAGNGFTFGGIDPRSLEHFHARFDRLVEFEPDTFTTEHVNQRVSRENVFTRGACN